MNGILKALYPPILVAGVFIALSFWHPVFILAYFVMVLDISARCKEYIYLLETKDVRYAKKRMGASWCGRTAAVAAIPELRQYYIDKGYRWWHITPDGFPFVFLKWSFWKSVVGIK